MNAPEAAPPPVRRVTFQPLNDQVLIKMDMKAPHQLAVEKDKPTMLPSGVVVAVGRGVFVPGVGFQPPQVQPGDHVALVLEGGLIRLPLSSDRKEVFVVISESLLIGKLEGADVESPWWGLGDEPAVERPTAAATRLVTNAKR